MTESTFTPPHPLKTAVLFLVFNRPDTTKQVFEAIRKAKPPRFYVTADGPREHKEGEVEKIQAVRDYVMGNIDWDCKVKTLFRDKNLGCKYAVSSAITWFFENEEMGIILEDDCLPSQSFFWFCEELLDRYKDDMRVWQINGFNPLENVDIGEDYYFSKFGPIWGWASWRRAWKHYDVEMKTWPEVRRKKLYTAFCDSKREKVWRVQLFDDVYNDKIDTWDYQWSFTKLINNGLSIMPKANMVQNIGFGKDATHTKGNSGNYESSDITFPLINPLSIIPNIAYDNEYFDRFVRFSGIKRRIRNIYEKLFS